MKLALRERLKELHCLYDVFAIRADPSNTVADILPKVARRLPEGFFWPEVACARVSLGDASHTSPGFRETAWRLSSAIEVDGARAGMVEVFYSEPRPDEDEGPFLSEERQLLDNVATGLGLTVEHKRALDAMEAERRFFETVMEDDPGLVCRWRPDTTIIYVNRQYCEFFGASRDELVGTSFLGLIPQSEHARIRRLIAEASPQEPVVASELAGRATDGTLRRVHWITRGLFDPDGTLREVQSTGVDVTELREATQRLERRNRQQAALAKLAMTALNDTAVGNLMQEATERLAKILKADCAGVFENAPDARGLRLRAGTGWRKDKAGAATVSAGARSLEGYALRSEEVVASADVAADGRFGRSRLSRRHGIASALAVPIPGRLDPHGVLGVYARRRGAFESADGEVLQFVAGLIAVVLGRDAAERGRARVTRAYRTLYDSIEAILHATSEERLLQDICRAVVEAGGYRMAWIGLASQDEARRVVPAASAGFEEGYLETLNITWRADDPRGRGPSGTAVREGRPCVVQHIPTERNFAPWRAEAARRGYRSSAALPVVVAGAVIGALNVYASEPDAFDAAELGLLEELANDLAYGIGALRTHRARQRAEERVTYLSERDPLTGLANRTLLETLLGQAIGRAQRASAMVMVAAVDLDRFKVISDTQGRAAAAAALRDAARRLSAAVRPGDTVARLAADLFVAVCNVRDGSELRRLRRRIADAFERPFAPSGREFRLTASLGLAVYPDDGDDASDLLNHAEAALHKAKQAGGGGYEFYSPKITENVVRFTQVERELRTALRNDDLRVVYQPQVDARTFEVIGLEALVRWHHPARGVLGPGDFIDVAEESGLIGDVGRAVMRHACADLVAWQAAGLPGEAAVSVNLSTREINEPQAQAILAALKDAGIDPRRLMLEVTETALIHNIETAIEVMDGLNAAGVGFSIDDFGKGYSSMRYLARLPFSTLKIDKAFVDGIATDPRHAEIVHAITAMAHGLGKRVVAEGVETREQLTYLQAYAVDSAQGFLFSRPVSSERAAALLQGGPLAPQAP